MTDVVERAQEARDSDTVEWLARLGLASRGVIWLIVGLLAVQVALGDNSQADKNGALHAIADLADTYGSGRVRTTTEQKMVILDVPPDRAPALVVELEAAGLPAKPSMFRRYMMACTGIEFCKLAIGETKTRAQWLYAELEQRMPDFD